MRSRAPGRCSGSISASTARIWSEYVCNEGNQQLLLGKENYMVSADGFLMPVKKEQAPPDLKYFNQPK